MRHFVDPFAWCMLQVTCFSLATAFLYLLLRRGSVRNSVALLMMSLAMVAFLTLGSASPWPRWDWIPVRMKVSLPASSPVAASRATVSVEAASAESPLSLPMPEAERNGADLEQEQDGVALPTSSVAEQAAPSWWSFMVLVAWTTSLVGLIRLCVGMFYLRRYRRAGSEIDDPAMRQIFNELRLKYGIDRHVALLESPHLGVAATIGWWRPTILLPGFWREWSADEQRAVLAHELAHVRERHFPTWIMGQLAVVTHFYNPLVHWLAQRLRLEQEIAADYLAAQTFGDRRKYAAILAGLALGRAPSPGAFASVGLFMSRPFLMRRIAMLDQSTHEIPRGSRTKRALLFGLVIFMAVGVAGLRASRGENDPSSKAQALVQAESEDESSSATDNPPKDEPSVPSNPVPNVSKTPAENDLYATALFQVSREPGSLMGGPKPTMSDGEWQLFSKTQIALLHSYFVLQSALRDHEIKALPIISSQTDPISWLAQHIEAGFYTVSEILYIRMACTSENQEQVKQLVDAVAKAYTDEVLYKLSQERLITQDALAKKYGKLKDELNRKLEDFYRIAKIGAADAVNRDAETDLILREISDLEKKKADLESRVMQQIIDFMVMKQRLEGSPTIEEEVDEKLKSDPRILVMQQQLIELQMRTAQSGGGGRGARSRGNNGVESQIAHIKQDMKDYRVQLIKELTNEKLRSPNLMLQQYIKEANLMLSAGRQQLAQLDKYLEEQLKKLRQKGDWSVDLETRHAEIEQLQAIAKDMSIKLASMEIESAAPARIKQLQPAVVQQSNHAVSKQSPAITY